MYTHNMYTLYTWKGPTEDVQQKKLAAFVAQGAVRSGSDSKHLRVFLVRSCVEIC